jgi:hypothetical protein
MTYKKISVRELASHDSAAWDELVRSSRQGIVYLLHDFLRTWTDTEPSLHLARLGCYDEHGQLVGGQAIFHRKAMGVRIQNNLNIFHTNTPILPRSIQDQGWKRYEVLAALAEESRKHFPYLRAEFHPSLNDARPFLEQGWRVSPKYTHVWDISDPESLLANMHRKRRYYVRNAHEHLLFACESGGAILKDFSRLYQENMRKFNWSPGHSWEKTFKKRVEWMQSQDYFRLYTCRKKDGQLLGMVTVILSRINQTAYGWLMAYDHSAGDKEFTPAINWFVARELSSDFRYYDIGEGYRPSLYSTKDSLGNSSILYWIVATQNTKRWTRIYNKLRGFKQSLSNILP